MHICCSICKELFFPNSEVTVTKCGHLYHESCLNKWQERSVSCPQCRTKLKDKSHRVYFDVEDPSADAEDASYLKQKIDSLNENISVLKKKNNDVERINTSLKDKVDDYEQKEQLAAQTIMSLKQRIKDLVKEKQELEPLKEVNESLRTKLKTMSHIETLIVGTECDVRKMLSKTPVTSLAVHQLCIYVEALKQQLKKCQDKFEKENSLFEIKYKAVLKKLKEHKSEFHNKFQEQESLSSGKSIKKATTLKDAEDSEIEAGCSKIIANTEPVVPSEEHDKCDKKIINNVGKTVMGNSCSIDIQICQTPNNMKTLKTAVQKNKSIFQNRKPIGNIIPKGESVDSNEVCEIWGRRNPLTIISPIDEDRDNFSLKEKMKNRYRSTIPQGSSSKSSKCNFKSLESFFTSTES